MHDEDVGRVRLGDEPAHIEHERIVGAGGIGLNLCQNRLNQIAVMDFRVETVGWKAANRAGDKRYSLLVVHRFLELGEYDQGRTGPVEPWVHARGDLNTTC